MNNGDGKIENERWNESCALPAPLRELQSLIGEWRAFGDGWGGGGQGDGGRERKGGGRTSVQNILALLAPRTSWFPRVTLICGIPLEICWTKWNQGASGKLVRTGTVNIRTWPNRKKVASSVGEASSTFSLEREERERGAEKIETGGWGEKEERKEQRKEC